MYREVRRARAHGRPLAMLALSVENADDPPATDRVLEQIQRDSADKYVQARVLDLLAREVRDTDVVMVKGSLGRKITE